MGSDVPVDVRGFKGLNLREPPGMIQDDELSVCKNLNIGRAGELTKRTGFDRLHDGATLGNSEVKLLGHYLTSTHSQLISFPGDAPYHSTDGANWTKMTLDITPSDVSRGGTQWAVQYTNQMHIITSGGGIFTWNGTNVITSPNRNTSGTINGSPNGTFGAVYKDRLFVLNSEGTNNSRLYFSDVADFTRWPSTNFIDVSPGDGDFLVAVAVIHDLLIIFKTKTTWALYVQGAPQNWILRNVNPEIGCISKYTPREIEGFLYFVGARGIYKTDGNIFEDISSSIEPIFRDRTVNLTTVNKDTAAWWEDRYIVLLHPDPSTYTYMVYHLRTGGWTEWEFTNTIQPNTFLEVNTAAPQKGLYAGSSLSDGRIYRHGGGAFTDAGNEYSCEFETKYFDFTLPSLMKRGKWIGVDIDCSGPVNLIHETDNVEHNALSVTGLGSRFIYKAKGPGYFRTWRFRLRHTSNNDLIFYGMTCWLHQKRSVIKAHT